MKLLDLFCGIGGLSLPFLSHGCRTVAACDIDKHARDILIEQGRAARPRKLTPRECARLQGLQDSFQLPCSDSRSYNLLGNSVAQPVIEAIAKTLLQQLSP